MKRVWIRSKNDIPEAVAISESLKKAFQSKKVQIVSELSADCDLCICISGDGTLLSSIQEMGRLRWKIPVLGIHGSYGLGFLHSLSLPKNPETYDRWAELLVDELLAGHYAIEDRWGLLGKLFHPSQEKPLKLWALNDFVIAKGALSRMVRLRLTVDSWPLIEKARGDGMIISSAMGSTGYSMSAGGPMIHPSIRSMTVTPVCLHRMSFRPLVLNGDAKIQLEILESTSPCYLTVDGQRGFELEAGQMIEIECSKESLKWVVPSYEKLESHQFYEILKKKLGFGG